MVPGLVSTIIPVFNRSALLRQAVASVLAQAYRPIEMVIVDDGSTDDTPQTCAALAEEHREIIRSIRVANGGPGAARAAGTALAQGEFVQYLDSDDILQPEKFDHQVAALRSHPECGAAYCRTRQYWHLGPPTDIATARTGELLPTLFPALLQGRCWRTLTPLYRRTVLDQAGVWSNLRQDEDWEFEARVAALGTKLVWCDEFLADVLNHDAPRAGGGSRANPALMRDRCAAHRLIYEHARRAGVSPAHPAFQSFTRSMFLLAREAGAIGLTDESRTLFELAQEASRAAGQTSRDFRIYAGVATCLGWRAAGMLACWWDRWRPRPTALVTNGRSK